MIALREYYVVVRNKKSRKLHAFTEHELNQIDMTAYDKPLGCFADTKKQAIEKIQRVRREQFTGK